MENNITSKELLRLHYHGFNDEQFNEFISKFPGIEIKYIMVQFAKLKCQEQLQSILRKAKVKHKGPYYFTDNNTFINKKNIKVNKDSIINAYDLNSIK
jgi:hypothetical protein